MGRGEYFILKRYLSILLKKNKKEVGTCNVPTYHKRNKRTIALLLLYLHLRGRQCIRINESLAVCDL
nr:MAG TPA: hypothetical protein [Caudoviricetes sp.]